MDFNYSTKREIRAALAGSTIRSVEFGAWEGDQAGEGETRTIVLHMRSRPGQTPQAVEISATSYQTLKITEISR